MSEDVIINHCSPTLANIKTGNIFSCSYNSREELTKDIQDLNKKLKPKGLRVVLLRLTSRALIYIYRPKMLKEDISNEDVSNLLESFGYPTSNIDKCVVNLCKRISKSSEFPHEIGLFLGYPFDDVKGFIENKAANFKMNGYWKVYGDENQARKTFLKYERCTSIFTEGLRKGKSIEVLSVKDN